MAIRRVEVLDATGRGPQIAAFEGAQLDDIVQTVGGSVEPNADRRQIASGRSAILFIWVALDRRAPVPALLRHRVLTSDAAIEGAEIGTHHSALHVFAPPLTGSDWMARSGPSNGSYHRRGILVFVADGRVAAITDGIPDNVPAHEGFRPAVPLTMQTLAGNMITLDVGGSQFAYYMHLQPGSITVKKGDRVRRGTVLARVGNSGDAREPHLHFEVTNSLRPLVGGGGPYLIEQYGIKSTDDSWQIRTRELPLADMMIDFGKPVRR